MNNLYNQSDKKDIIDRLEKLTIDAERQWETMSISQMLAHCNVSLETAMSLNFPKKKINRSCFWETNQIKISQ